VAIDLSHVLVIRDGLEGKVCFRGAMNGARTVWVSFGWGVGSVGLGAMNGTRTLWVSLGWTALAGWWVGRPVGLGGGAGSVVGGADMVGGSIRLAR